MRHVWPCALFKRGQVVQGFPRENIVELVVEDVCLGPAFTKGESVPFEEEVGRGGAGGGCVSCVASLAYD